MDQVVRESGLDFELDDLRASGDFDLESRGRLCADDVKFSGRVVAKVSGLVGNDCAPRSYWRGRWVGKPALSCHPCRPNFNIMICEQCRIISEASDCARMAADLEVEGPSKLDLIVGRSPR